jgi:hypothetical protein
MWNVVGASVVGTSHGAGGLPCQDCNGYRKILADGIDTVIAAIADGAGSAAFSDEGSRIAVETILDALETLVEDAEPLDENAAIYVIDRARTRLREIADQRAEPIREFACTLLFAVVSKKQNIFAQVGDGAWAVKSGTAYYAATWPHRGEYANQTFFITSADWKTGFKFTNHPLPIDAFAGFTDGIQTVALRNADNAIHGPFLDPLVKVVAGANDAGALVRPLEQFLSMESLNERTDDDKTLLIAARRSFQMLPWPTSTDEANQS